MFCIEKICRPCKGKEKEMKSPYKTQVISYLLLIKIKQLFYNEPEKNYKNDCQKKTYLSNCFPERENASEKMQIVYIDFSHFCS